MELLGEEDEVEVVFDRLVDGVIANGGGELRIQDAHVIELSTLILRELERTDELSKSILRLETVQSWGESGIFEIRR